MAYLVYEMESVQEVKGEPRKWIDSVKQRLENTSVDFYTGWLPHFEALGHGLFKKRLEKFRLLAAVATVEVSGSPRPVVVLLDFLSRSDPRYADGSLEKLESRYRQLLNARLPEIAKWACEKLHARKEAAPSLSAPPPDLLDLLQPLRPQEKVSIVYESSLFRQIIRALKTPSERAAVFRILQAVADSVGEPGGWMVRREEGTEIHYTLIIDPETSQTHVFLIGLQSDRWSPERRRATEEEEKVIWTAIERELLRPLRESTIGSREFSDRLGRLAERAYPTYLLADEELWNQVDSSREVFLPLSAEEVLVLEELLAGVNLPCVIEGRAGSGKTTLLTYYIPERLLGVPERTFRKGEKRRLLFLTQSDRLRDLAEKTIRQFLERLRTERGFDELELEPHYLTFHRFALGQLPVSRRRRFVERSAISDGGWINFYRFRALLNDPRKGIRISLSREARNPEIAWFVIRSYLKGFKIHEEDDSRWLSPEEYEDGEILSRKDRQISRQVYTEVWEKIWPWYKALTVTCQENDFAPPYWDDLDLAWEVVLHRAEHAPTYAVLVCDEVQDFTRVEFAAAFGALDWVRHNLSGIQVHRIPVVLAGDAHQTVNPSCFRWARVKVDCAQALVQHLPNCELPRITPYELRYNYRNARNIALLCNTLQAFRQFALGAPAQLQRIWNPGEETPNQTVRRLILEPHQPVLQELLEQGVLAVGPEPYTDEESVAASFWKALGIRDCQRHFPSYVTPADIKGLEHDFVAVVGFGTLFRQLGLQEIFTWKNAIEDDRIAEDRRLTAEYFLNRLYAAVSRPRRGLWILETPDGWDALWAALLNWQKNAQLPAGAGEVGFSWVEGETNQLLGEFSARFDELAEEFEKLAEEQMSPQHAERAAFYHRHRGDTLRERLMLAQKLYFEGNCLLAADRIWELGEYEKASRWYWEAGAWDRLNRERITPAYRREVAAWMLEPPERRREMWLRSGCELLRGQMDLVRKAYSEEPKTWAAWKNMISELLEVSLSPWVPHDLKREVYELLDEFATSNEGWGRNLGRLAFQLGDFARAVTLWEISRDTQTSDYFRAKAQISNYPECLRWWESAGEWAEIVYQYETHSEIELPVEERRRVARAANNMGRPKLALRLLAGIDSRQAADVWRRLALNEPMQPTDWEELIGVMWHAANQATPTVLPKIHPESVATETSDSSVFDQGLTIWTDFLFDLLLYLTEDDTLKERHDLLWRPIVYGFRLGVAAPALRTRFAGSWENRQQVNSRWAIYAAILQKLLAQTVEETRLCYQSGDSNGAVNLCEMALDIMFRWPVRRREEDSRRGDPFREAVPVFAVAQVNDGNFFGVPPELHASLIDALRCVAEAPPDWWPNTIDSMPFPRGRDWRDRLEAVSFELVRQMTWMNSSAGFLLRIPDFEDFLAAGKFVEQSPFRKAAVEFYRELKQLAFARGWPPSQQTIIQKRLELAIQRHQQFLEDRDRDTMLVRPGEERQSDLVRVRSLEDRPEIILETLPDLYRFRFRIHSDQHDPHAYWDREIRVTGPFIREGSHVWQLVWRERQIEIVWNGGNQLTISADRQLRIQLASGPHSGF